MRAQGSDTSFWNSKVNYGKMKAAGISFCYAKASQLSADSRFKEYWPAMKQAGLLRGAYHYLDWRTSELDQAKLFVDTMGGDWGELPPVLDLEMNPAPLAMNLQLAQEEIGFGMNRAYRMTLQASPEKEHDENLMLQAPSYSLSGPEVRGKVWNFLKAVEKATGKVPMIYSGYYYWKQWMTPDTAWERYPFWLAWYASELYIRFKTLGGTGAPPPWKNWTIWQYDGNGNGPLYGSQGLSMDMNWFNGTVDDLARFANAPIVPPVTPPAPIPDPNSVEYIVTYTRVNVRETGVSTGTWVRFAVLDEVVKMKYPLVRSAAGYLQMTDKTWIFADYVKPKV
jgi:lysozyme